MIVTTIEPGDEMNDVFSDKFVSGMNFLDDEKFNAAIKALRKQKKLPPEDDLPQHIGRKKTIED